MSCYSHITVTTKMDPPLTDGDVIRLKELMEGNCSLSKKVNIITNDDIDFDLTLNYGFDKVLDIVKFFEERLVSRELINIGSIYSEGYSFHRPMDLFITPFKKIVAVFHDTYHMWHISEDTYTIMGSDGKFKSYSGINNDVTRDGSIIQYLTDMKKI